MDKLCWWKSRNTEFLTLTVFQAKDFRLKGTTSSCVGLVHTIVLRALDDYGNPAPISDPPEFIGVILTHQESGRDVSPLNFFLMYCQIQPWCKDNHDCTYDITWFNAQAGTVRLQIKLAGNPMFDITITVGMKYTFIN